MKKENLVSIIAFAKIKHLMDKPFKEVYLEYLVGQDINIKIKLKTKNSLV